MLFHHGTASTLNIKAQEGKELVIEWNGKAHISDRYLDVVNDWFHNRSLYHASQVT